MLIPNIHQIDKSIIHTSENEEHSSSV